MRKFWTTIMIGAAVLMATGCESNRVIDGKTVDCVGIDDEAQRDPNFIYEVSTRNIIVGVIFFEFFFIPPIVVALDETFCPVAKPPEKQMALAMGAM